MAKFSQRVHKVNRPSAHVRVYSDYTVNEGDPRGQGEYWDEAGVQEVENDATSRNNDNVEPNM